MESMRGTRLGAVSYERDENVAPADRIVIRYVCPEGHVSVIPFSSEAEEIPYRWTCRCGDEATSPDVTEPPAAPERHQRTHWDMLLERRSREDLQELLEERLTLLRQGQLPRSA